jgi:hypothetical protein
MSAPLISISVECINPATEKGIVRGYISKTDRPRPGASLDIHRSFENYLADRIKEEKKVRKQQSTRRMGRGPQVRGTALQPTAGGMPINDRLAKWTNECTLEGYVTARHLLTRRRIRQREK